jgi:hypothetical protein
VKIGIGRGGEPTTSDFGTSRHFGAVRNLVAIGA